MKIRTAYLSEVGGREKNDDTVSVIQENNKICVFVGDGLGGYDGGRIASQTAAEAIKSFRKQYGLLNNECMAAATEVADDAVKKQQEIRQANMKTTIVVLEIDDDKAKWMHVGDSRLYHFQKNKIVHQTMDHSVSQVAVLMGEITQNEIRFHEDRNRVLRALGSDNAKPEISPLMKLVEDSVFLLCTDGFWEYVYENEMEETLKSSKSPEEWLKKMSHILVGRVMGENDNYTAAAVFCEIDN